MSMLKIIILGTQGVGKTSLMERFVAHKFTAQYKSTIGADFSTKEIIYEGKIMSLQIWDTAGQERYQSLGTAFYRGADACFLVFDVGDPSSFNKLQQWRDVFIQAADIDNPNEFPFVLVGNKCDIDPVKHSVTEKQVSSWAESMGGMPYFFVSYLLICKPLVVISCSILTSISFSVQVSAKTGENVEKAFLTAVAKAATREKAEEAIIPDTLKLDNVKPVEKKGCEC